ncbi:tryptophan-rich sensory protein [Monoraphidium neglectum]|uniref:Tryptophan-rich sensory protein n=1 Tax=Monoraphidium neglectum TaxID=145388 RepID=A0A0D2NRL4_9CHLO|nr:tryptophan-rich sensory protein [Monoraphidium neglectum]KIZ06941.1 tryptophan-rich sensory protein [Monoraphidium neglectum]|eukprot:XP_013905960.1 tryptophan-rich sensory protein [Monoraphidium neglectum]
MSFVKDLAKRFQPEGLESLPKADLGLLGAGVVVFGVQRLVPTYDNTYYKEVLKKPNWTPPNWVFPAVWIPLKLLQSVSLWLVIKKAPSNQALTLPLLLFGTHLALGNYWNWVFFGQRQLKPSLKVMGAFWLSIAGSIAAFNPISPLASLLFAPTQVWVTIAAKLNYDIVKLNENKVA